MQNTWITLTCSKCGNMFRAHQFSRKAKTGFCSRQCSGKISKRRKRTKKKRAFEKRIAFLKTVAQKEIGANFYLSGRWRVLRYEVIKERGNACEVCGASPALLAGTVIHVDHIKPRHLFPYLEFEKSNLQILCEQCNKGKGAWDQTDWSVRNEAYANEVLKNEPGW